MRRYLDIAIEEGVRFFVTSLGNPRWVVDRVAPLGGIVYHDVTERKWAEKGLAGGVHGLIAVNDRAGGHAGPQRAAPPPREPGGPGGPPRWARGAGEEGAVVPRPEAGDARGGSGDQVIGADRSGAPPRYK